MYRRYRTDNKQSTEQLNGLGTQSRIRTGQLSCEEQVNRLGKEEKKSLGAEQGTKQVHRLSESGEEPVHCKCCFSKDRIYGTG